METTTLPQGFEELGVGQDILRALQDIGYESPTPIQRQAIPVLMEGRDLMAQSQTGTGKTAAFAIPMIEKVDPNEPVVQGLVLAPTRELSVQVAETIHKLGRFRGVTDMPIYGGQPYDRQLRALKRGVQIVVGTPGRLMDHIRRGTLDLSHVRLVVLDEADQMLDMGFIDDIEFILDQIPGQRQIALFSATIPPRIRSLSKRYLSDPEVLTIAKERVTVPEVSQYYVETSRQGKLEALSRILDMEQPESAVVFVRTKRETDELGESLVGRGYLAEVIHGDLTQSLRQRAITGFRDGRADILVATDVAARGLDIPNVSHVINYDIPEDPEAYVHRIGRTARAGKSGSAITFVTPRERGLLKTIERLINIRLTPMRIPSAADIAERRTQMLCQTIADTIEAGHLERYITLVDSLGEQYDLSEIAAAALKMAIDEEPPGEPEPVGPSEDGMERLFIRIGRRQGVSARDLVGAIANEANIPGRSIGAIDIYDNFSFVEVPASEAGNVMSVLQRSGVRGKQVSVKIAMPNNGKDGNGRNARPR